MHAALDIRTGFHPKVARSDFEAGSFESYAIVTESSTGEGPNIEITGTSYELAYYEAGKRRDLAKEIRRAVDWCDRELTAIEAKLPPKETP
ncbi:MAG TPA: hypothetical protein VKG24_05055 [Pseudolabrys sp.]|nr:hypothetical protein [Pseudolabrys sp.]